MASEDLFSQGVVLSEDILLDKENLIESHDEIETNNQQINFQPQQSSTEIVDLPEDVPEEPHLAAGEAGPAAAPKEKPAEKSNDQRLTSLPLSRIRNLMKLDPDLHIASLEAVFTVTKATELFIDSLAKEAFVHTSQAKKKTIQKRDVDMAIASVDSLMFLEGAMNF